MDERETRQHNNYLFSVIIPLKYWIQVAPVEPKVGTSAALYGEPPMPVQ